MKPITAEITAEQNAQALREMREADEQYQIHRVKQLRIILAQQEAELHETRNRLEALTGVRR